MPLIEMHSAGIGTNGPFECKASAALRRSPFVQVKNFEDMVTVELHGDEGLNAIINNKQHRKMKLGREATREHLEQNMERYQSLEAVSTQIGEHTWVGAS
jgi:hypothetical protein